MIIPVLILCFISPYLFVSSDKNFCNDKQICELLIYKKNINSYNHFVSYNMTQKITLCNCEMHYDCISMESSNLYKNNNDTKLIKNYCYH